MRVETLDDLRQFTQDLAKEGSHLAEFGPGDTTLFICGRTSLREYVRDNTSVAVFSDFPAAGVPPSSETSRIAISIGSAAMHDAARHCAADHRISYATCPAPLSNDAFATDRMGGTASIPAATTCFPAAVILDWDICASLGEYPNVLGIGEVLGLITSTRDYANTNSRSPECDALVALGDQMAKRTMEHWSRPEALWRRLTTLAACLTTKASIIRLCGDNTPIAGSDHLVAYELSRRGLRWPHGKLVFAGVLLTLPLLHDSPESVMRTLIEFGAGSGLFDPRDSAQLQAFDITAVLEAAPDTRPDRQTVLRSIGGRERATAAAWIRKRLSQP